MHGAIQKVVVTSLVMRPFCIVPGAPRACADFCDPTAASRFNDGPKIGYEIDQVIFSQVLRACADFCDPTPASRFNDGPKIGCEIVQVIFSQVLNIPEFSRRQIRKTTGHR